MLEYVLYWIKEFNQKSRGLINDMRLYNHCRKCWELIDEWLRCPNCKKLVDQEFKWEASRPFRFYFTYYNKCRNKIIKSAKDVENS